MDSKVTSILLKESAFVIVFNTSGVYQIDAGDMRYFQHFDPAFLWIPASLIKLMKFSDVPYRQNGDSLLFRSKQVPLFGYGMVCTTYLMIKIVPAMNPAVENRKKWRGGDGSE